MIGWLYRILIGTFKECDHEWELVSEGNLKNPISGFVAAKYRYWECKKCKATKENTW